MNRRMNRRTMLRLTAFTAVSALAGHAARPALAQQKLVLKASDVHPLGYPTVEAVVRMGKALEAGSGGRLSIQMYPSMQLGGEKEMIEQAQVGALAIARVSVGPMGPMVPELNVFNLPFMFRDDAHMEKVIDGEIGSELLKKLTDHPTSGLVGLCWMNAGTRHVYNSKKPIKAVEDLKGLKIRMMENTAHQRRPRSLVAPRARRRPARDRPVRGHPRTGTDEELPAPAAPVGAHGPPVGARRHARRQGRRRPPELAVEPAAHARRRALRVTTPTRRCRARPRARRPTALRACSTCAPPA